MAKGQIKTNKEVKKPKKSKEVVVPNSANNLMKPAPKKISLHSRFSPHEKCPPYFYIGRALAFKALNRFIL